MISESSSCLVLERQESLAEDRFAKNGMNKEVHIVAKNIPFNIHVSSSVNLNTNSLGAKLIYDFDHSDQEEREVEQLKTTPIEYTAHVDDSGFKAVLEVRLGVLSSQHEAANFIVKFFLTSSPENYVHTFPLKVISKRNQVRKMMLKRDLLPTEHTPAPPAKKMALMASPSSMATLDDASSSNYISASLARLEEHGKAQQEMLQQLLNQNNKSAEKSYCQFNVEEESDPLHAAFRRFMNTFKQLSPKERPSKIKHLLSQSTPDETQTLFDFMGYFSREQQETSLPQTSEALFLESMGLPNLDEASGHSLTCTCDSCPHKQEVARWDDFYNEFLSTPEH